MIDRRLKIFDLKSEIAKHLHEDISNLIFLRGGSHGSELMDDDLSFKQGNIYNMMSLFVKRG